MNRRHLLRTAARWSPLILAGCVPVVMPSGPEIRQPGLSTQSFTMSDGGNLPYFAWLPKERPNAVILCLHGFGDYSFNAFDIPAPAFTSQGVALYAYDQRGFGAGPHRGLWPGVPTLVADCGVVIGLLAETHPGIPIFVLGESMGAAVALVLAATQPALPVAGYILSAPGVRGRASMSEFSQATLEIASRLIPAVGFSGAAPGFSPSDNEDAMRRWSRDPLTVKEFRVDLVYGLVDLMDQALDAATRFDRRALILYGAQDRIVPPDPLRRLLATMPANPERRVAYYRQGHHLLLRDRGRALVIGDILAWLALPRAPLPSGADRAAEEWLVDATRR
jgi:alpha-beta hydrolase superfamily lysophospholipase